MARKERVSELGEYLKSLRLNSPFPTRNAWANRLDLKVSAIQKAEDDGALTKANLNKIMALIGPDCPQAQHLLDLWAADHSRALGFRVPRKEVDWYRLRLRVQSELGVTLRRKGMGLLPAEERALLDRLEVILKDEIEHP